VAACAAAFEVYRCRAASVSRQEPAGQGLWPDIFIRAGVRTWIATRCGQSYARLPLPRKRDVDVS
jgi:hypothetical protein